MSRLILKRELARHMTCMYFPFCPSGFTRLSVSMNARRFSSKASSVKLTFPMPACTMPFFSARNWTCPPFNACRSGWITRVAL